MRGWRGYISRWEHEALQAQQSRFTREGEICPVVQLRPRSKCGQQSKQVFSGWSLKQWKLASFLDLYPVLMGYAPAQPTLHCCYACWLMIKTGLETRLLLNWTSRTCIKLAANQSQHFYSCSAAYNWAKLASFCCHKHHLVADCVCSMPVRPKMSKAMVKGQLWKIDCPDLDHSRNCDYRAYGSDSPLVY